MRRVYEDQTHDGVPVNIGEAPHVDAADGMAHQDKGAALSSHLEQCGELVRDHRARAWRRSRFAPKDARPIVGADASDSGHLGLDRIPRQGATYVLACLKEYGR